MNFFSRAKQMDKRFSSWLILVALFAASTGRADLSSTDWMSSTEDTTSDEAPSTPTPTLGASSATPPTPAAAPVSGAADDKVGREAFGPKARDLSISFDAVPMLNFALNVVNIFGNTGQTADGIIAWPSGFGNTISMKYMLTDAIAIRGLVGAAFSNTTTTTYYAHPVDVADPDVAAGDEKEIQDSTSTNINAMWLGGGAEYRDTLFDRLQGYGGVEARFGFGGGSTSTDYGWRYNQDAADFGVVVDGTSRVLRADQGMFGWLTARAFVGVEYFIVPKVSLGAEYGLSMTFAGQGRGVVETETWNAADEEAVVDNEPGGQSEGGFFATGDLGSALDMTNVAPVGAGSLLLTVYF